MNGAGISLKKDPDQQRELSHVVIRRAANGWIVIKGEPHEEYVARTWNDAVKIAEDLFKVIEDARVAFRAAEAPAGMTETTYPNLGKISINHKI